ncbi:TonB family protein [Reyranella sp.]|uniref:TonB family protein n=1 Tax=Reyranella sp. TaxID=1929291 RepID=UPI003D0B5C14
MAHAVSAFSYRSDRMSPVALALAILLHALVAAALWWMAQQKPPVPPVEEAINVSFEQPKPPDPPPPEPPPKPPAAQPKQVPLPQTLPPINLGVRPPAPVTGDRPTQAPPTDQVSKEPPAPPPPPESKEEPSLLPQPEVVPPTPTPPVEARVEPPPAPARTPAPAPTPAARPTPEPPTEQGLKKAPTPPPPAQQASPSPESPVKPAEPVPTPKAMPQQQALAAPPRPPPPAPKPELKPSPLSTAPAQRPPSASSAEPPTQHRFVNPSDTYARAKVADNYLSEVLRKIVGYRYTSSTQKRQGLTVVRIVIARDGRLLGATVISSSGEPEFDEGVLAGVRAGSPYSPLPDNIKGASAPFDLPLVSIRR